MRRRRSGSRRGGPNRATAFPPGHRNELLAAFKISEIDIRLNEQGRLGPAQSRRLRRGVYLNLVLAGALLLGFATILFFTAERPVQAWRWLLIGVLAAALIATGVVGARRLRQSVHDDRVERYSGVVRTVLAGRLGARLIVDGHNFALPVSFWHVGSGLTYDVYLAPRSKVIVAMVPISSVGGPS